MRLGQQDQICDRFPLAFSKEHFGDIFPEIDLEMGRLDKKNKKPGPDFVEEFGSLQDIPQ